MKKIISAILLAALLFTGAFAITSSAIFGTGTAVFANDVTMIKTGLLGHKLNFSEADFKSTFAVSDFNSITVTRLPLSTEGMLLIGGRRVKEGQKITRRNTSLLVFVPKDNEVTEARFSFKLDGNVNTETECIIKFIDRINYAPEPPTDSKAAGAVVTQREIAINGKMAAIDPEGDKIEFIVVSYPKNGYIATDKDSGKYSYTPEESFCGYDSFAYVARDEYGNYSPVVSVGIRVIERMSGEVFVDMTGRDEYNAAVAMSAIGVMSGKTLGDDTYFMPEESVSRAEFVSMLLKAYGIKKDTTLGGSHFDDNDEIPTSLVGYVATAERLGIVDGDYRDGKLVFEPNRQITVYEAALIMARLLGLDESDENTVYSNATSVPIFARASISAMLTVGIFDGNTDDYTRAVTRADAASYLYRLISI